MIRDAARHILYPVAFAGMIATIWGIAWGQARVDHNSHRINATIHIGDTFMVPAPSSETDSGSHIDAAATSAETTDTSLNEHEGLPNMAGIE